MLQIVKRAVIVVLLVLSCCSIASAQGKWITVYIAGWQSAGYPDARIDWTAATVGALAFWTTNTNGTLNDPYSWNGSRCAAVVAAAHAAGSKVIASLGGASDSNFATAVATNQATLLTSMATVVNNCGMDGVDLDWENSINNTNFINLGNAIRSAHPTWIITVPIDPTVNPASLALGLASSVTQDNMQTYGTGNFFSTSQYFGTVNGTGTTFPYVDRWVQAWHTAGVPYSQIGIGAGFYGNTWTSPVSGVNQTSSGSTVNFEIPYGWSVTNGGGIITCYYPPNTTASYFYDPSPALSSSPAHPPDQPSLSASGGVTPPAGCPSGTVTWVTYEDEKSIADKAAYIKTNGLGGIIIWTGNEGASDPSTGRNPLLDELNLTLNGNGVNPLPQLGTVASASVSTGTTTIGPITGLAGTDMIDVKWWSLTSGCAWDWNNSGACGTLSNTFGMPKNYTIQGATGACSSYTTLTTVLNEQYAGRQFAYDNSSNNYACIKMIVTSINSGAAGHLNLTVNGSTTSYDINDTVGIFGDSIDANCFAVNYNAGDQSNGVEQLGTQIHAARPARFPVATVMGNSGWTTSTALSSATFTTAPTSEIAIKRYMEDMPALKYVGISLGTNDANGGVSSATYCSRMQQIAQYVIAAGKTPIIPTLIPSPGLNLTTVQQYNTCLATLEQNFPAIIPGPDLYSTFLGHSTSDGWFFDSLHPSVTNGYVTAGNCNTTTPNGTPCGCLALQQAWATSLESSIYPLTSTSAPPAPATQLFAKAH